MRLAFPTVPTPSGKTDAATVHKYKSSPVPSHPSSLFQRGVTSSTECRPCPTTLNSLPPYKYEPNTPSLASKVTASSFEIRCSQGDLPRSPHALPRQHRRRLAVKRRAPTRGGCNGPTSHDPMPMSNRPIMAAAGTVFTQLHGTLRRRRRRQKRINIPQREMTEDPAQL